MQLTNYTFFNSKNLLYIKPVKGLRGYSLSYRFQFNGQEKDDEVSGAGNTMTATFGEYDSRLGRRFNRDPKPNASLSVYSCFANNPIFYNDVDGDTVGINLFSKKSNKKEYKAAVALLAKLDGKNDGVFVVYGHGHNKGVEYADKNDNVQAVFDAKGFDIVLTEKSNEWRDDRKEKKKMTLILYTCNADAKNYTHVYKDGTKRNFPVKVTYAEKLAEYLTNVTLTAANGNVLFGFDSQGNAINWGVRNTLLGNGRMATFGKLRVKSENKDGNK